MASYVAISGWMKTKDALEKAMTANENNERATTTPSDARLIALLEAIDDNRSLRVIRALAENVRDEIDALRSEVDAGGGDVFVNISPGVRVPVWLIDSALKIERWMKLHNHTDWKLGDIQSRYFAQPTPPAVV